MLPDRTTPEKKALRDLVYEVVNSLDEAACLCDAGELAALGLDDERDRYAIKRLMAVIGDLVRRASDTLAPGGTLTRD